MEKEFKILGISVSGSTIILLLALYLFAIPAVPKQEVGIDITVKDNEPVINYIEVSPTKLPRFNAFQKSNPSGRYKLEVVASYNFSDTVININDSQAGFGLHTLYLSTPEEDSELNITTNLYSVSGGDEIFLSTLRLDEVIIDASD